MSAQIHNTFNENGFVIVSDILTHQESQLLKAEIQTLIDAAKCKATEDGQDPENVAGHGVYVGLSTQSQIFRDAVKNKKILDVLQVILSPNIEFLSDKAVFKSHRMDFDSPWHQDWHYWHGSHKISVWIGWMIQRLKMGVSNSFRVVTNQLSYTMERQTMDADLGIVFSLMLWTNQRQSRQRSLLVAGSSFMT